MAIRWAVENGNWSNVATWDGGASLPTQGDIVHADGKAVTIDQNIVVGSIRTTTRSGGIAGGSFVITANFNITADIIAGSSVCLTCTHTSGSIYINGSITGGNSGAYIYGLNNRSTGNLVIVGSITGGSLGSWQYGIYNVSSGNITVTGNVSGGTSTNNYCNGIHNNSIGNITVIGNVSGYGYSHIGIHNAGAGSINVTGDVIGGNPIQTIATNGIYNSATGSITVVGNLIAASNTAITNNGSGTNTITGILYPSNNNYAINMSGAGIVVINGDISSSPYYPSIYAPLARCTIKGNMTSVGGVFPICCTKLQISPSLPTVITLQSTDNSDRLLMTSNASPFLPALSDVRKDVIFGVNNDLVGTLAVPPKSSVVSGVPTDDGIGTFAFTPELITRLSNCATVESVGEQLEALM